MLGVRQSAMVKCLSGHVQYSTEYSGSNHEYLTGESLVMFESSWCVPEREWRQLFSTMCNITCTLINSDTSIGLQLLPMSD